MKKLLRPATGVLKCCSGRYLRCRKLCWDQQLCYRIKVAPAWVVAGHEGACAVVCFDVASLAVDGGCPSIDLLIDRSTAICSRVERCDSNAGSNKHGWIACEP